MFCIAVTWPLGPLGSRKYFMVWMGGLTPERFYKSFYWYLVGLSNQIPLPLLQCPGQELLYLMKTHYPDYNEFLSAAVSKTVRQETPGQEVPAMVNAFMLHPWVHMSLYLSDFLSLSAWVLLSIMSMHPFVPVHIYQNFTSQTQPWNSPSFSPPPLPALESSFVTVGPSPSLCTCFFN